MSIGSSLQILKPNERAIEVYSKPDKEGNQHFAVYWYSEQIGRKRDKIGNAVQHFNGNLQQRLDIYKKENVVVHLFDIK